MSTNSCLNIVFGDKNSLLINGLTEMFMQDELFDVRATYRDLFLKLLDHVSIDVGIIGWKMPYADGHQVLTKLQERESKFRAAFYNGADVEKQVCSLGRAAFHSKAKPS